ncbi:leucine-rich repeat domain-containing protein [Ferruginibacter sp.]
MPLLEYIDCNNNKLVNLQLQASELPSLDELWCMYNPTLLQADLHGLPSLTWCQVNQNALMKKMDVSYCPKLVHLFVQNCILDTINLTGSSKLVDIYLDQNSLDTLDLHSQVALTALYCSYNPLRSVDISNCPLLWNINFRYDSSLTYLNLKNGTPFNVSRRQYLWQSCITVCMRQRRRCIILYQLFSSAKYAQRKRKCLLQFYTRGHL